MNLSAALTATVHCSTDPLAAFDRQIAAIDAALAAAEDEQAARIDDLAELCEALRACVEPDLSRMRRWCETTVRGRDDWATSNLVCWVRGELDAGCEKAMHATTVAEAIAQVERCRVAAASIDADAVPRVMDELAAKAAA